MERETHSVWYQFVTKTSGALSFKIVPLDTTNDYDFALYRYTGSSFCQAVQDQTLLPVRTNFSRNKAAIGGKTGLHASATEPYVPKGVQAAYSSILPIQKGDTLVLFVNNVYHRGQGHYLHFDYVSPFASTSAQERSINDVILVRWSGKVTDTQQQYYFVFLTKEDAYRRALCLEVFCKGYYELLNPYQVTNALMSYWGQSWGILFPIKSFS